MNDMNPMEAEVDLENHRHEDEFSPACELHDIRGCRRCLPSICDVEGHFNSDWVQDCCECHGSGRTWNVDNGEVECGSCEGTGGYCLKCGGTVETNDGDVDTLSPTDKLLILLDDSISLKERLERTEDK